MKVKLIILLFLLSFIKSSTDPPSTIIWQEIINAIDNETMVLAENKRHFIYDQKNYLNEEIKSTKMLTFYQKQENVYIKNGIENYIFLVEKVDENLENIDTCVQNLKSLISNQFGFSLENSIILLISMGDRKIKIKPGTNILSKFNSTICNSMLKNIGLYMNTEDYYDAMIKFLSDVDYYYNKKEPSAAIWENVSYAMENGKMNLPSNKGHFIYDEKNYLNEEINSTRMLELYKKQENVYVKNGISNYIFIVKNIDEDEEDLKTCATRIMNYIYQKFGLSMSKSIVILFSMDTRRIRIEPGTSIEKIFTSSVSSTMITNLQSFMRSSNYYRALEQFINDVDYYYNKKEPSKDIWEKVSVSINNGKMIVPPNKRHFIFDENNYIKEEINSERMQVLYEKQDNVYIQTGISNYIFLVKYIDEKEEDLENCAKNVMNYISQDFGFTLSKSIVVLFSLESKRIRIQPGNSVSNIFNSDVSTKMINNLGTYMRSSDYYNALIKLVQDIDDYSNGKSSSPSSSSSSNSNPVATFFGFLFFVGFISLSIFLKRKKGLSSTTVTYTNPSSHYSPPRHHHSPPRYHSPPRHDSPPRHYSPPSPPSPPSYSSGGDGGGGGGGGSGGGGGASGGW